MQHKRSPPGQRRLRNRLFLIALAVLFAVLAAVGCTAGPHFTASGADGVPAGQSAPALALLAVPCRKVRLQRREAEKIFKPLLS